MTSSYSEDVNNGDWIRSLRTAINEESLLGTTCRRYSKAQANDDSLPSERCLCGRFPRRHSFQGTPKLDNSDSSWEKVEHTTKAPVTVYGIWQNKTKFIRWDSDRVKKPPAARTDDTDTTTDDNPAPKTTLRTLVEILKTDAGENKPILLISCFGGAKYFKMNHKLEKEFKDGIGQAAATDGVWLLSTGLNSGVSKVIGQSVERHTLLSDKKANFTIIGLSSWGCVSDRTRQVFRQQARQHLVINKQRRESIIPIDAPDSSGCTDDDQNVSRYSTFDENEPDTFENNHTHFLMLDNGSEGEYKTEGNKRRYYLTDKPRSRFVDDLIKSTECHSVTILIEGGLDSLDVISHDLLMKRPVVIIHGSGRCATVVGNLLEVTRDEITIENDEIERQFKKHIIPKSSQQNISENYYSEIQFILEPKNRPYLSVFKLDNNTSLTDTIFLAIYKAEMHTKNDKTTDANSNDRMKILLDLAVMWNCGIGIDDVFENNEVIDLNQTLNTKLFEKALIKNRPAFVDYFLRKQYNVLQTIDFIEFKNSPDKKTIQRIITISNTYSSNNQETNLTNGNQISTADDQHEYQLAEDDANVRATFARKFIVEKLYQNRIDHLEESYQVHSFPDLDKLYYQLIGPYVQSFFYVQSTKHRIEMDRTIIIRSLRKYFNCCKKDIGKSPSKSLKRPHLNQIQPKKSSIFEAMVAATGIDPIQEELERYASVKKFGNEEMLRDIFLWSVISGHTEMSFVLLLQIRSRIIASLIAAGITSRLGSAKSGYLDQWHKFHKQSEDYEQFATGCIDACYKRSEKRACQLLLREIPLFGDVTCMQVAISFRLKSFINSRCFNQVLNRQWHGTLHQTINEQLLSKIFFIISIISLGLLAPVLLDYRNDYIDEIEEEKSDISKNNKQSSSDSKLEGVNDQNSDKMNYFEKVEEFHRSPIVRMFYHFFTYIWMLLAFSYMMLFEMKSENQSIHWTEIYVLITISTMLIEDIRKLVMDYLTQMLERWHKEDLWIISLYALPYILFYIGIGLHFGSKQRPDLFRSARIVLAVDLEVWFLFSLRFVSAIKLLGPKLFMIRNMLQDLIGFIYIIFVCIAAYGIVSRSLTMYNNIEFTAKNLSFAILYRPYWFLYSIVDDERNDLNAITESSLSTTGEIAEATTNQVLLAFHMLFINILILNLLIAVFNFSINDVQQRAEYLWRYQRYELIREYFEKPHFAYPPLSLIGYLYLFFKFIFYRKKLLRIFKRFSKDKNKDWTDFENAATYNHTRTFVDRMYRDSSTLVIPTFSDIDELKIEVESLKRENNQIRTIIDRTDVQSKRMIPAVNWIMKAMKRVKMSSEKPPLIVITSNPNN